jgi:hypothetical protein
MTFQPEKIARDHVLKAIADIDNEIVAVRPSTKFDILYQGKTYPPKDVMRLAHEYATGEYLWIPGGGEPTNKYLRSLGFEIISKTEVNPILINVKNEFVDWMVANVSGGNYFKNQFASNRERFENEINEYEVKYKENFNSELFIFSSTNYKNEIELIRTNLYNTSNLFSEYSNNLASGRPKAMLGKKNYLRFLEERFGTKNIINYWIFQGNPKIYNAVDALNTNAVKTWTVSAHKEKIKKGDKFILWQTGTNAGCYALGSIASEVSMMKEEEEEMAYYLVPTPQIDNNRVKIVIEKNFANNPILWEEIKELPVLAEFKAGNQGTNFSATKAEYDFFNSNKIPKSQTKDIMSSNNLNQILFGPPGTGKTFNTINEALKIVDPDYFEVHENNRKKLTDRFKELLIKNSEENKGQIAFCTFHQSFSYEDFVEGIKPKTTDTKSVYYDVEPGIFKRICQLADSFNSTVKVKSEGKLSWDEEQYKRASFYKLSLGEAYTSKDREIYEYCRDNGYIAMGFGAEYDFTGLSESEIVEKCADLKLEWTSAQKLFYSLSEKK